MEYAKLWMLGRKKNVDIVIIAQLDYSIDKYFRDLSYCSLYMDSFFIKKNYLYFEATIYRKDYLVWKKEFDLFYLVQKTFFNYNTLEESIIWNEEETKRRKIIYDEKEKKRNTTDEIEKRVVGNFIDIIA